MQTNLDPNVLARLAPDDAEAADRILRSCVHCGFCNATCPTYQVLGDENDGPRGRIYLMKEMLEGEQPSAVTRTHLDRCLTCRACETTCPSGVEYGQLLDIGRQLVAEDVPHQGAQRWSRAVLRWLLPKSDWFGRLLRIGQAFRPWLPAVLAQKVPPRQRVLSWPEARHERIVALFTGCVQSSATPATNIALARWLDQQGISAIAAEGCCGALHHHLGAHSDSASQLRDNAQRWQSLDAQGELVGFVSTASGCGVHIKDYGHLGRHGAAADMAATVAQRTHDAADFIADLVAAGEAAIDAVGKGRRVAVHTPCTLQHGQQSNGVIEGLLTQAGYEVVSVADGHLCCGSAGSHSMLQPTLANELRDRKLSALTVANPQIIATANVGCQLHLGAQASVPLVHWLELLAPAGSIR